MNITASSETASGQMSCTQIKRERVGGSASIKCEGMMMLDEISVPSREIISIIVANHDGTFLERYRRSDELSGPKLVRAMRGIIISGPTR